MELKNKTDEEADKELALYEKNVLESTDKEHVCEKSTPTTFGAEVGEGIGCVLMAIALAIIIWAVAGFPGLLR